MDQEKTKIYLYGRPVIGTPEEIEALEVPEGLTSWVVKEKATNEGTVNSNELFFTMKELTAEEIAKIGVIDLGFAHASHFYMSEKINGQYVTYVTSDPTGPGMVLYPVSWKWARIYVFKSADGRQCYQLPFTEAKLKTSNPNEHLCTKELALEYGVSLNNPYQDPQKSELIETILAQLTLKANASNTLPADNIGTKQAL